MNRHQFTLSAQADILTVTIALAAADPIRGRRNGAAGNRIAHCYLTWATGAAGQFRLTLVFAADASRAIIDRAGVSIIAINGDAQATPGVTSSTELTAVAVARRSIGKCLNPAILRSWIKRSRLAFLDRWARDRRVAVITGTWMIDAYVYQSYVAAAC